MRVLIQNDGRTYSTLSIKSADEAKSISIEPPFVCMIWDHGSGFSVEEQSIVASLILKLGCRYFVCGGDNCEQWHDVIDDMLIMEGIDESGKVTDRPLVMTTWHTDDPPNEVTFFFVNCSDVDDLVFKSYLLLHAGEGETVVDVESALKRSALYDDVED